MEAKTERSNAELLLNFTSLYLSPEFTATYDARMLPVTQITNESSCNSAIVRELKEIRQGKMNFSANFREDA